MRWEKSEASYEVTGLDITEPTSSVHHPVKLPDVISDISNRTITIYVVYLCIPPWCTELTTRSLCGVKVSNLAQNICFMYAEWPINVQYFSHLFCNILV